MPVPPPSPHDAPILSRMAALADRWERAADHRAAFLRCYLLMTRNTLGAVRRDAFHDPAWVGTLLHRFADYYFDALDCYERDPLAAPAVWQLAHDATCAARGRSVHNLFLGVSAHINYDLVLALCDVLEPEWEGLTARRRAARYADHCRINDIIGRTIDAVQDEVVGPALPIATVLDRLLGPIDEMLVARLVARWREQVWRNAVHLLDLETAAERTAFLERVEADALRTGAPFAPERRLETLLASRPSS